MARVLHVLSQRPSLTGSGITLDALVRFAAAAGWQQRIVAGVPRDDAAPEVGGLGTDHLAPLVFDSEALPFPVPGMSDVMPYRSTVFSSMDSAQLARYRRHWRDHLSAVIDDFAPQVIHAHHLWIVASLLKDVAPEIPVVNQCHATGLRQMLLCPGLAPSICERLSRNEAYAVLHAGHADQVRSQLQVDASRVHVIGAGYRDDIFHARNRRPTQHPSLLYVGKYSASKGLPQLLDAVELLQHEHPSLRLNIAGSGSGDEADALRARMTVMPGVHLHGQLDQDQLADLARRCWVSVLPSFYEGVPLVLVEALACGCRLIATDLPGVQEQLAPHLGVVMTLVPLPDMQGIDTPKPEALPTFVDNVARAIRKNIEQPPLMDPMRHAALERYTWHRVFERVERIWRKLI